MPSCTFCGTFILFGGVKDGPLRFCNEKCHEQGTIHRVAKKIPRDSLRHEVAQVHQGPCPHCAGPGPVDVHSSHRVWSIVILSSYKSEEQVSCRSCARKWQYGSLAFCAALGWWSFWGLLMTPIYLARNAYCIFSPPDPNVPSERLVELVRLNLAAAGVEQVRRREEEEEDEADQNDEEPRGRKRWQGR